jgi:hypothetical protein
MRQGMGTGQAPHASGASGACSSGASLPSLGNRIACYLQHGARDFDLKLYVCR